ncbi:hypothetical protein ACFL2B_00585 [Patescibacteria group bacterium]
MKIWLLIICLIIPLVFVGCSAKDTATQIVQEGEVEVADLPVDGKFFTLERVDQINDSTELIEVNHDGQVKVKSGDAADKASTATKEELTKMGELIKNKDFEGLKQELKIENSGSTDFKETLTLFSEEGRQEVFNITEEDLSEEEKTIMPDKWDLWFGKVRRFFGNLTGEEH